MKKRYLALLLALVMLLGVMAGCSKPGNTDDPSQPGSTSAAEPGKNEATPTSMQDALTAKYAYKVESLGMELSFDWINQMCAAGNMIYISANVQGEEITETDEETGEQYTYNEYRDGMFALNMETNELKELENFSTPDVPEGWEGSANVQSMLAANDGTLWVLVNIYSYRFNIPDDVDQTAPDFDRWSYYENGSDDMRLLHLAADGSTLGEVTLSGQTDENGNQEYLNSFQVDDAGNIYAASWQNIYIYDAQGNSLFSLSTGDNGGNLCKLDGQRVGISVYNYDEQTQTSTRSFKCIDVAAKDFSAEEITLPNSIYNFFPGDDVYDIYYDNSGKIFGYNFDTGVSEKVVDWMECDINSNNVNGYALMPDGRVVACYYDYSSGSNVTDIIVLNRVDASTLPAKKVITLACQYTPWDLRDKIISFNKGSDEYRIVVKDYSENAQDDPNGGLMKLNTEIMSGKVPDLFLCSSDMPVDKYAGRGLIADLYEFIDNDPELGRDKLVQPVLKALEKDGKLYELPTSFALQTAGALNKVVDEYSSWTVADVKDAMTKLQPDATVFSAYYTKNDVLNNCVARNLASFVDWTKKEVHFDSEEFIALLDFCNQFPAEFNWDDYDWETEGDDRERMNSGRQLMQQMYFSSFDDYLYMSYGYDSGIRFVGFPTQDGSSGSSFSLDTSFAISASSPNRDAAWAFVRDQLLSQQEQSENDRYYVYAFPVLKSAYDAMVKKAMTPEYQLDENGNIQYDENGKPIMYPKMTYMGSSVSYGGGTVVEATIGGGEVAAPGEDSAPKNTDEIEYVVENEDGSISVYAISQEQVDAVNALIENTKAITRYDNEIMQIVNEETAKLFAGDGDAASTAAMVQSRVNLYVQEQG